MAASVYNVIWADDEIDSYRRDITVTTILNNQQVKILDYAHTSSELKEKLNEWEDVVDAVITDGNFDKRKTVDIVRSTSGLSDVLSFIHYYNRKRVIPFFLYTGKPELLREKFTDGELEYFEKRNRLFEKGTLKKMLINLKSEVDRVNTPSFRIRNKYTKEFEAAKHIDDADRYLMTGLLYLYEDDSWKNVQDYFNPARKIVERMMTKCMELNILPPKTSLNNASRYFSNTPNDNHIRLNEEIMPRTLAESLFYFLKITQDGSHDENDMNLGVDKYVRENKNINLYRTILYIVMDLLVWFDSVCKKYENNQHPLWEEYYEYEGKVCCDFKWNYFYTGQYEIAKSPNLKDGVRVRIYESSKNENKYHSPKYPKYVKEKDYKILE